MNLSEERAREFVMAIDEVVKEEIKESKTEYRSLWKDDFTKIDSKFIKIEDKIGGIEKDVNHLELKIEQTKDELTKAIFWTTLIQFLAIVASVIGIVSFMMHK